MISKWLIGSFLAVLLPTTVFAAGAAIRDWDFSGPTSSTAQAMRGIVSATYNYQTCFTCNTRAGLQMGPTWQSCIWRLVWDPLDSSGGVQLNLLNQGTGIRTPFATLEGFSGGIRTDTVNVTAALNGVINPPPSAEVDILQATKGSGVVLYSSRIHCTSVDVRPPTPTVAPSTLTPTMTPTRTPGGDFFCPRP